MLPKPDILQMVEDGGADGEFFWARRWGDGGGCCGKSWGLGKFQSNIPYYLILHQKSI